MKNEQREVIIFRSDDGQAQLDVHLTEDTVWLTQAQMTALFARDKRTISEHIRNVFKEGELVGKAVVRKSRTTAGDGKGCRNCRYTIYIYMVGWISDSASTIVGYYGGCAVAYPPR
jgi:hypothetical protein